MRSIHLLRKGEEEAIEQSFGRELSDRTLDLYRSIIENRLDKGEAIQVEHHVMRSHVERAQSILSQFGQEAISLFATEKQLIRLHSTLKAGSRSGAVEEYKNSVDAVPYGWIGSLKPRRRIRVGELGAGAAMLCAGLLLLSWLSITGPFMVGLGALGMLHAVLLPTLWVEVVTAPAPASGPILIYSPRKESARRLMEYIRGKTGRLL